MLLKKLSVIRCRLSVFDKINVDSKFIVDIEIAINIVIDIDPDIAIEIDIANFAEFRIFAPLKYNVCNFQNKKSLEEKSFKLCVT